MTTRHEIVKCPNCGDFHSTRDRTRQGQCPACEGWYEGYFVSIFGYEMEVSKQQEHYPALRGVEIRPDWILEAYKDGVSPVQFLNGLLDAA